LVSGAFLSGCIHGNWVWNSWLGPRQMKWDHFIWRLTYTEKSRLSGLDSAGFFKSDGLQPFKGCLIHPPCLFFCAILCIYAMDYKSTPCEITFLAPELNRLRTFQPNPPESPQSPENRLV
jgi:hypothetical protein